MRYIKVFLLVLIFLLVMMFFVQNQSSFADPVVLRMDTLFFPPLISMPMPLYSIMLICFGLGAFVVLLMLIWDRISSAGKLSSARHRVSQLEKKLKVAEEQLAKAQRDKQTMEDRLQKELAEAEQRVNTALRAAGTANFN